MAKLKEIISVLEGIAPSSLALSFDNSGLNVGDGDAEVTGVTVCLDATSEVVFEAVENGHNLIVSHHPIIFAPIENLTTNVATNNAVMNAVKNGVNVFSMHTNLDCVDGGINDYMAELYGLKNARKIAEDGVGRIGETENTNVKLLAKRTQEIFGARVRVVSGAEDVNVSTVALVNGAGGDEEYLKAAKEKGAQCFITCEIKHHIALYAKEIDMPVIETEHYATEKIYIPVLKDKIATALQENGIQIEVKQSQKESDPFNESAL